jgi:hypothetical protein
MRRYLSGDYLGGSALTETPVETPVEQTDTGEYEEAGPQTVNCRHCGRPNEVDVEATPDWLCPSCERYQDSMLCPTCSSVVRISLMPDGSAPEAHAPVRSRKAKE